MAKIYRKFREYVTPILKDSKFVEEGVLTPEEFVVAGDQLVFKSPVWKWASGDPAKVKPYLPAEKQFLICRGVRCSRRVADIGSKQTDEQKVEFQGDTEGEWTAAGDEGEGEGEVMDFMEAQTKRSADISALIKEEHLTGAARSGETPSGTAEDDDDDDDEGEVMDLLDFESQGLSLDDSSQVASQSDKKEGGGGGGGSGTGTETKDGSDEKASKPLLKVEDDDVAAPRMYDVSILYDKRYRTPRVYLIGYDSDGAPLTGKQMFEDIMPDYRDKTVTMEQHPHLEGGEVHGSIHPCRHARVMKSLTSRMREGGIDVRPEHAMFVFLKFIASVIPTIEYDMTFSLSVGGGGGGDGVQEAEGDQE